MNDYAGLFSIEKGYIALNHGSFGACPTAVLEHNIALQKRMESLTTRFFSMELKPLIIESLRTLAAFVKSEPENLVFVRNATTAANAVINSLPFLKGDEIVITNLIYEACRTLLNHLVLTKGVVLRVAQIPFPAHSEEQIVTEIMNRVTDRTKLVFLDHITSETATIMPLAGIVDKLKPHSIPIFVDGAHAPGMIPLDLQNLGVDFYTGNCHKWLCSPKGAAFLYVRPELQKDMIPPVIGLFFQKGDTLREQYFNSFFWAGTGTDYLSCCSVKKTIEYLETAVEGGWKTIMERNRQLVRKGRDIIKDILRLEQHTPDSMTGSMVTFRLNSRAEKDPVTGTDRLLSELLSRCKIECFIASLYPAEERILRISAHLYNKESDYVRLAECLAPMMERES